MGEQVAVRDARPDELDAVAGLLVRCFREYLPAFPRHVADAYLQEVADVRARAASSQLVVAQLRGHLVGSVTFLPDAARDGHPWPAGGCVLRLLAVHPDVRGRGIGGLLTDECVARARRRAATFLGLHSAPFMTAARRLYRGRGFVRTAEHDFDPHLHYGHDAAAGGREGDSLWGLAYILWLAGSANQPTSA